MHPQAKAGNPPAPAPGPRTTSYGLLRSLDVWARCAPIRVAGCEDVPRETHILRGID
jgi:hypothetical protein